FPALVMARISYLAIPLPRKMLQITELRICGNHRVIGHTMQRYPVAARKIAKHLHNLGFAMAAGREHNGLALPHHAVDQRHIAELDGRRLEKIEGLEISPEVVHIGGVEETNPGLNAQLLRMNSKTQDVRRR